MHWTLFFFFSSRRRHTRFDCDWSSDVCSSDLGSLGLLPVLYVVAVLTVLAKPAFVVVLMTGHALGRCTEIRAGRILSFQECADLREHVRRGVALFAVDAGMFALQGISGQTMIELVF